MKLITVCVQYDDLLALTLPRNAPHFEEVVIVTSPTDRATAELVNRAVGIRTRIGGHPRLFQTDAFYRNGAEFNKGAAIEEAFDVAGRTGWFCHLDADVVLPRNFRDQVATIEPGHYYGASRRCVKDPTEWDGRDDWSSYPLPAEKDLGGFLQVFHADDPAIAARPWYPVNWRHAGNSDTWFAMKWAADRKYRLDVEVLHLGPSYTNWFGRTTARLDGTLPEGAADRRGKVKEMLRHRHRRAGFGFSKEKVE